MSDENGFEDDLLRRLEKVTPPDLEGARKRAVTAAWIQMSSNRAERSRAWRPVALASLALLAVLLLSTLTAPGQAVAEWVGQRFGIGEPGGQPTLVEFRERIESGGETSTVIARGPLATGGHFEILTWAQTPGDLRCFGFDIPHLPSIISTCFDQNLPPGSDLHVMSVAGNEDGYLLVGRASPAVASVRVESQGAPLDAQLIKIDRSLLTRLGIDHPLRFIISEIEPNSKVIDLTAKAVNGKTLTALSIPVSNIPMEHP